MFIKHSGCGHKNTSIVGLVLIVISVASLKLIAPDSLMPKVAKAALSSGDWAQLTGKDAELEAKIAALETRVYMLENKPCSCQATGSAIDNSGLNQRIDNLEAESKSQKGLLDTIFALLVKLQGLLVQILSKSLR